jgi:replicative DNA helicase
MNNPTTQTIVLNCAIESQTSLPYILSKVKPEDFENAKYKTIYEIIKSLYENKQIVSLVSITKILYDQKLYESHISSITEVLRSWTGGDIKKEVKDLIDDSCRRQIVSLLQKGAEVIIEKGYSLEQIYSRIDTRLKDIMKNRNSEFIKLSDLATGKIEDLYDTNKYFRTGIRDLDAGIYGLKQTKLIVLAAQTSKGKSALAGTIGCHIADKYPNQSVLFASLEMEESELRLRFISHYSKIDSFIIEHNKFISDEQKEKVKEGMSKVDKINNFEILRGKFTLTEILTLTKQYAQTRPISLMIIDYLQLINHYMKGSNREQVVSEVTRQLKLLAMELRIPILALSQLSRSVDNRKDNIPILSDLRESGAIEQHSDMIMFLYHNPELADVDKNSYLLEVAKNRGGKSNFEVNLYFTPEITTFENL